MERWYVVHTQAQSEKKAFHHLVRQGFRAYLPQYLKRRRHARRTDWIGSPLFPRYLFVAFDHARTRWRAINSTIGVHSVVCNGGLPAPVPQGIVEDIRAKEDENGMVPMAPRNDWRQGDVVQITDGPFAESVGLFDCFSDEQRVVLLLTLLGRQVKVRVPLRAVCAVA